MPLIFGLLIILSAALGSSIAAQSVSLGLIGVLALADRLLPGTVGWRRTPLDESLLFFMFMILVSALFGLRPGKSLLLAVDYLMLGIFYVYVWYAGTENAMKPMVRILLATGAVAAVYAVIQHYSGLALTGDELKTTSTFASGPVRFIARGFFSHHQTFANVMFLVFCLSLSLAMVPAPFPKRLAAFAVTALMAIALVFSYTRGIWLASLAAVLTIAFFRSRRAFVIMVIVIVVFWGGLIMIPSSFSERALSVFTPSRNIDRFVIWEMVWAIIRDYPIVGVGGGNLSMVRDIYLPPHMPMNISRSHAHNSYFQIAINGGIFALLAYLWIWYVLLRMALSSLWFLKGREGFRLAVLRGATAGIIGFMIDGLFQHNFGDAEVLSVIMFLMAVITVLRVKQTEKAAFLSNHGGGPYAHA